MKHFETVQKYLAAAGFAPNQQQNKSQKFSPGQIFGSFLYSINTIFIGLSVWEANGFEEYINPIFSLTIFFGATIVFINFIFINDKIFNVIELVTNESNFRSLGNLRSRAINESTNRLVEKCTKIIYFVIMNFGMPGAILPRVLISYLTYLNTDDGSESFELPFPSWLPFDWKNPTGYFIATIWQSIVIFNLLRFMALILTFALGAFLFAFFGTQEWKHDLYTLDEMVKTEQSKADIMELVIEFIRSHSTEKQLVDGFVEIFEVPLFVNFMCCTVTMLVVLMMFQVGVLSKDTINPVTLWNSIFLGFCILGSVFTPCEIGQRFSDKFEEISDQFEQLNWYLFPIEVQRILPTILVGVQKPIVFECYGVVECSREQFKKVVNVVYKTFNVLREIFN